VRPPCGERVWAALGAPGQISAQIGLGVLAGGALEPGQVASHREPHLIGEWHKNDRMGRRAVQ
jgi:hypothetical protein